MRHYISIAFCLFLLGSTSFAAAQPSQTPSPSPVDIAKSRVDTMLRTGHADPAWFSASFLSQVPASKVDEIVASLATTLGKYTSLEFTPEKFIAHFAKGTDDVLIHLDAENKIDALFFRPPIVTTSSLDDALQKLVPAEGTLSYVITEEGRSARAALNASAVLAVGSAFKLAVLNAIADSVSRGSRKWSDVVPLQERWRSLPTGVLRTWPAGTPLTLATYAVEMMSISDNTAADALATIAGANALKAYAGSNDPFLTTREVFALKSERGSELRKEYLEARTPQARKDIALKADGLPLPSVGQLLSTPELAIEWHYTVKQLCGMMQRVADLPAMTVNPGVAEPSDFRHVAFKGGSDTGVINLTTMVTTKRGTKLCFSATLNDPQKQIDETGFESAYAAVLRKLAAL